MPQINFSRIKHSRNGFARKLAILSLMATICSCSNSNTLDGSLTEILDMKFSEVSVSITDSSVVLEYYRPHGAGQDIVFKLAAQIDPTTIAANSSIDLGPATDGSPRASVTRAVTNDPIRTLASIKRGSLVFDDALELDKPVSGEFRVTLDEGGDAGKGRTAFGNFRVDRLVRGD